MKPVRFVIEFNGMIPLSDIADALHGKGLHIRSDGRGVMVVDPVPTMFLRQPSNVVTLTKAKARR